MGKILWSLPLIIYAVPRPTGAKLKVFGGPLGGTSGPSLDLGPMVKNNWCKLASSEQVHASKHYDSRTDLSEDGAP